MKCPICGSILKVRVTGERVSRFLDFYGSPTQLDQLWETVKDKEHLILLGLPESRNKAIYCCPNCSYAINYNDVKFKPL